MDVILTVCITQVEQHFSDWCCEQSHLIDGVALFLSLPAALCQAMKASGRAAILVMVIMICNLCVLTKLWLFDPAKYKKWRLPLRCAMCATSLSFPYWKSH
jgi:hypothetical protein